MSKSINELEKFLKKINIPIVTTWSGLDVIDFNHKNYIGSIGVYGSRAANFAVQNADKDEYLEFRISQDDITDDVELIITEYVNESEEDIAASIWDSAVNSLRHIIGA